MSASGSGVSSDYKEEGRRLSERIEKEGYFTFKKEDLQLDPFAPGIPYVRRSLDEKTVGSWGQFKLFLGILEFICLYHKKSIVPKPLVLYIGAAPGLSFPLLSEMFPNFDWDLWDSANFGFESNDKITIHNTYFFDKDALQYKDIGHKILFLSDIRTIDSRNENRQKVEETIWKDMLMQQEWVRIINPYAANLKFRLPYGYIFTDNNVNYLSGRVLLQGFVGPTSTETRLVPDLVDGKYEEVVWDIRKYEEQMMYHNSVIREKALYYVPIANYNVLPDTDDIINNYDGCYMIYVFNLYLDYIGYPPNNYPPGTPEYTSYNEERFKSAFALSLWVRDYILSKRTNVKSFREIKIFTRRFMEGKIDANLIDPEDLDDGDFIVQKFQSVPSSNLNITTGSLFPSSTSLFQPSESSSNFTLDTISLNEIITSTLPTGFVQPESPKKEVIVDTSSVNDLLSDIIF